MLSSYIRVIDIILGFIILWGAYKGFRKGFVLELISTFIFVVGVLLFFVFFAKVFEATETFIGQVPKFSVFSLYLFLYLAGGVGLNWLGRFLQKKIDYSILDEIDNTMAFILGGLKYASMLALLLGLFDAAGLNLPEDVTKDSYIYPNLLKFQDWLVEVGQVLAPTIGDAAETVSKILERHAEGGN